MILGFLLCLYCKKTKDLPINGETAFKKKKLITTFKIKKSKHQNYWTTWIHIYCETTYFCIFFLVPNAYASKIPTSFLVLFSLSRSCLRWFKKYSNKIIIVQSWFLNMTHSLKDAGGSSCDGENGSKIMKQYFKVDSVNFMFKNFRNCEPYYDIYNK